MSWRPTAKISTLKKRAEIIDNVRQFFKTRGVLEVETPLLSHATVPDPNIPSFAVPQSQVGHNTPAYCYLQTSPEFAMKRLLAAESESIFQICKAFRRDEISSTHNPEFTMLEWYRTGFDHHQLMSEMDELLQLILDTEQKANRLTYQELFEKHVGINPHKASTEKLSQCAKKNNISIDSELDKDQWLDLLLSYLIQPKLQHPTFVYNYPTSQAALSRINNSVAERFEVFIKGYEIANGFHELSDAKEQNHRFQAELIERKKQGMKTVPIDSQLLSALEHGLPDCAGVALGVDRLVMLALGLSNIKEAISFDFTCS